MIQLQILSGKMAGHLWVARRFPVRIGRSPVNDLQLEEPGVWDEHLEVTFDRAEGFGLTAHAQALVTVNQQPVQQVRLRNGDTIEAGAVRLRFWLGETRQRGLGLREWMVWTLVIAVTLGEVLIVYWLLQ